MVGLRQKKGGYASSSRLVTELSPPPRTPAPGGRRPSPETLAPAPCNVRIGALSLMDSLSWGHAASPEARGGLKAAVSLGGLMARLTCC